MPRRVYMCVGFIFPTHKERRLSSLLPSSLFNAILAIESNALMVEERDSL